ncbi:ankyrin repeat domain-containing protein [Endozoicomonas sp. SESOKO2]|uniref:ankyrin repeat domain-containing protein n=1 Tax=Endozoicomonas sp. SESOKO2 TaxID=2828743 RepID=UPI0021478964|nr:ankyrin repeat domain-containing protein [Endozoicomonas sp. SESOKO2]
MDISKTGTQPLCYGDMTTVVTRDKKVSAFMSDIAAKTGLPRQTTLQESYPQDSAPFIVDRNISAYAQSDEAAQRDSRDSLNAQKRPLADGSDTVSQLCKIMKSDAMAISGGRVSFERFAESLAKVITDPDSTDADTSEAVRLVSEYGADELAKYTVPFSFHINTTRSYPAITHFALACRFGKLDLVKALYVNQEQLNQTFDIENGTNGRTALMLAVIHGHANVVEQLLTWGANVLILDEDNNCVDRLNLGFNANNPGLCIKIRDLLIDYRNERGLPPFKEPALISDYITDTGEDNHYCDFTGILSERPELLEKFLSVNPVAFAIICDGDPVLHALFRSTLRSTNPSLLESLSKE